MGSVHNTTDKFGRREIKNQTLVLRGQQGIGIKLTPYGDYDLQNKRLTNVGESKDTDDAVTRKHLDDVLKLIKQVCSEVNTAIDKLDSRINKLEHILSGSQTGK